MARGTLLFMCVVSLLAPTARLNAQEVDVLVIVPDYYGANLNFDLDNLQNFGWNITTAGVSASVRPCPSYAGPRGCPILTVDVLISEIGDIDEYDVVAIMPGSMWVSTPYGDLMASQAVLDLIADAVEQDLVVFAPCGAVRVLAAADVLDGVTVTGHPRFQSEYEAAGATFLGGNLAPVIDGRIVTATRGMYFHEANCEAIAVALESGAVVGQEVTR